MNDFFRIILPLIGVFCGLLTIFNFHFNKMYRRIEFLEQKIIEFEKKIENIDV